MTSLSSKPPIENSSSGRNETLLGEVNRISTPNESDRGDKIDEEEKVDSPSTTSDIPAPVEETNAPIPPSGPPGPVDHGLICWLQVVGTFAMWMNVSTIFSKRKRC